MPRPKKVVISGDSSWISTEDVVVVAAEEEVESKREEVGESEVVVPESISSSSSSASNPRLEKIYKEMGEYTERNNTFLGKLARIDTITKTTSDNLMNLGEKVRLLTQDMELMRHTIDTSMARLETMIRSVSDAMNQSTELVECTQRNTAVLQEFHEKLKHLEENLPIDSVYRKRMADMQAAVDSMSGSLGKRIEDVSNTLEYVPHDIGTKITAHQHYMGEKFGELDCRICNLPSRFDYKELQQTVRILATSHPNVPTGLRHDPDEAARFLNEKFRRTDKTRNMKKVSQEAIRLVEEENQRRVQESFDEQMEKIKMKEYVELMEKAALPPISSLPPPTPLTDESDLKERDALLERSKYAVSEELRKEILMEDKQIIRGRGKVVEDSREKKRAAEVNRIKDKAKIKAKSRSSNKDLMRLGDANSNAHVGGGFSEQRVTKRLAVKPQEA